MSEQRVSKWSDEFLTALSYTERLSYASKMADGAAWAKRKAMSYIKNYGDCFDAGYARRITDNFLLLSGNAMYFHNKRASDEARLDVMALTAEGLEPQDLKMKHYDSVSFFVEGHLGDQQRRQLKFGVTDSSLYTENFVKREEERVTLDYFRNKFILPAQQQISMQLMQERGVKDPYEMKPEERQQMQADVASRVDQMTPRNIKKYFKYGAKGELEKRGQELANIFVSDTRLKFMLDQAYYHSYASGAMIFKQGIRNNRPYTEHVVDLRKFNTWGSPSLFVDNNTGFRHKRLMHPSDIIDLYGQMFTREDYKNFSDYLAKGSAGSSKVTTRDEQFVLNIPFESLADMGSINMLTREGQRAFGIMEDKYSGSDYKTLDMVAVYDLVWKSLRKYKEVQRLYPDGTIRFDWHGENYTFNPLNGDIKIKTYWFNEYFKVTVIGEGEHAICVDIGPFEVQFRDVTDPRNIRGPYTGAFWNDMQGMGQRNAPLDKIKNYVDAINFEFKIIHEKEATDVGKVMLMTVAAKPAKWTWGKYIRVIRQTKIVPIDTRGAGLTAADVAFFKELDLSNMWELIPRVNVIQTWMNKIAEALAVNDARRGAQAASTSVTNNMTNLDRSFSQTHNLSEWYDAIAEKLIQNGIYLYRMAAKNGNIFVRRALSDSSIFTIDSQVDDNDDPNYFVKVFTDEVDLASVDIGKNIAQPMLQNQGDIRDALRLMTAKAMSQIDDVLDDIDMDKEIKAAQMQESGKMERAEMLQAQKDIIILTEQLRKSRELLLSADKKEMAGLNAMTQANASDINKNQINDFTENNDKNLEFKYAEMAEKTRLKQAELDILRATGEKLRQIPSK